MLRLMAFFTVSLLYAKTVVLVPISVSIDLIVFLVHQKMNNDNISTMAGIGNHE
jgi:hypothetical protein